ncbi:DUF7450 family protein [Methyloterricola oryzae]|uniref:DUF7450 family protein n=1 Tax=Methyloterricola oryzae TaxID=1495050 RepID=UPI0005EB3692|nr:hypothetical protein [Methyloterricola oryzae]
MSRFSPLTALCGLLLTTPLLGHAACPAVGQPVIVAQAGVVNVTMHAPENPNAAYTSKLYLDGDPVYGSVAIFESHPLNTSQTTPEGTTLSLGSFEAGHELVFRLEAQNETTKEKFIFYSGNQSRNAGPDADGSLGLPGLPHAALSASGSGDIVVRFEDAPGNGECPDGAGAFTDFTFAVDNVETVLSPDRFLSYKAKPAKVTNTTLALTDATGAFSASISKRASLANPAKIGVTEIISPDPSLVGYSLTKPLNRKAKFSVVNELGSWTVNTKKLDRILLPSSADKSAPTSAPQLSNQGVVDTYACYTTKVKGKKNLNSTKQLQDELSAQRRYKVTTPSHFCAPTGNNGASAQRPDTFLMCYAVTPTGKPAGTVNIANSLESAAAKVQKADEYCVPSTATKQ